MFNDVLRKPLVTLILGAENAHFKILFSCVFRATNPPIHIPPGEVLWARESFSLEEPCALGLTPASCKIMQSAIGLEIYFDSSIEANLCTLRAR